MSEPKNKPAPSAITEAGAVELAETELDKVSGGPIYMQYDGVKSPRDVASGQATGFADNLTIKLAQGKNGI